MLPAIDELMVEAEPIDVTIVDAATEVSVSVVVDPTDEDVKVVKLPERVRVSVCKDSNEGVSTYL